MINLAACGGGADLSHQINSKKKSYQNGYDAQTLSVVKDVNARPDSRLISYPIAATDWIPSPDRGRSRTNLLRIPAMKVRQSLITSKLPLRTWIKLIFFFKMLVLLSNDKIETLYRNYNINREDLL